MNRMEDYDEYSSVSKSVYMYFGWTGRKLFHPAEVEEPNKMMNKNSIKKRKKRMMMLIKKENPSIKNNQSFSWYLIVLCCLGLFLF